MRARSHVISLFVLMAFLTSCGATAQQRAIHTSKLAMGAAVAGFVAWDKLHQEDIVAKATNVEDGASRLAQYRLERKKIEAAFHAADTAIKIAEGDPSLSNIDKALAAVRAVYELASALTGTDVEDWLKGIAP